MALGCVQVLCRQGDMQAELKGVEDRTALLQDDREGHAQRCAGLREELATLTSANALLSQQLERMHAEDRQQASVMQVRLVTWLLSTFCMMKQV